MQFSGNLILLAGPHVQVGLLSWLFRSDSLIVLKTKWPAQKMLLGASGHVQNNGRLRGNGEIGVLNEER